MKDVYINFPYSVKAEILGWIDINSVYTRKNKDIDYLSYYNKQDHEIFYDDLALEMPNRFKDQGIFLKENDPIIVFVRIFN